MRSIVLFSGFFGLLLLAGCSPQTYSQGTGSTASGAALSASGSLANLESGDVEASADSSEAETNPLLMSGATVERLSQSGGLVMGSPDAPVSLLVFLNLSSGYSQEFVRDYLPRLTQEFIARGLVRYEALTVPLKKYPESAITAAALFCAGKQGKGFTLEDAMIMPPVPSRVTILQRAKNLQLPAPDFEKCLDAPETAAMLAEQKAAADRLGVTLVPTMVLQGHAMTGLPLYPDLRGMIREEITKNR